MPLFRDQVTEHGGFSPVHTFSMSDSSYVIPSQRPLEPVTRRCRKSKILRGVTTFTEWLRKLRYVSINKS
ncbi:hypothetical protein chiPu_0002514 [Chiloscyllium punctatum]|uniref:Uncharacterized protein n=1 Tax=Chiloscyllium punctatum TaxID=137246 RepID=A0A401S130_CHIPU|nr:hypothetical protein [Chiloscyllium punctatum]